MEDGGTVLPGISPAPVGRLAGIARSRRRPVADPIPGAVFLRGKSDLARAMDSKCLAELRGHTCAVGGDVLSGMVARIFAFRNAYESRGSRVCRSSPPAFSTNHLDLERGNRGVARLYKIKGAARKLLPCGNDYWQGGPAFVRNVPLSENQPPTPVDRAL